MKKSRSEYFQTKRSGVHPKFVCLWMLMILLAFPISVYCAIEDDYLTYDVNSGASKVSELWAKSMANIALNSTDSCMRMWYAGYWSQQFRAYPQLMKEIVEKSDQYEPQGRANLELILWYADAKLLKEIVEKEKSNSDSGISYPGWDQDIARFPVGGREEAYFCSGYYFACKNTEAIDRLLSVLVSNSRLSSYE